MDNTVKRRIAAILAVVLGAFLLACESDPRQPGHNPDPSAGHPEAAKGQPQVPDPGAQPPAPKADPKACEPGCDPLNFVTFHVMWTSERGGKITIYFNGAKVAEKPAPKPVSVYGIYTGTYDETFDLSGKKSVGFAWDPDDPRANSNCTIAHNLDIVDGHAGRGPCALNWTVIR